MQMHRSLPHKILLYAKQRRGLAPADWMFPLPAWCNWSVCLNMNTLVFGSSGGSCSSPRRWAPAPRLWIWRSPTSLGSERFGSQRRPHCGRELDGSSEGRWSGGCTRHHPKLGAGLPTQGGSKFLHLCVALSCQLQRSMACRPAPALASRPYPISS